MTDKIPEICKKVRQKSPLIHCITNPISINECANAILSAGAKPIMAEHPKEVAEITGRADALMLNTGNITDVRMESVRISLEKAKEKGIPALLDAVGVACSGLRRRYVLETVNINVPSVIKGNYSEIIALYDEKYFAPGVDGDNSVDVCYIEKAAKDLALRYKTIILATGKTDIITDGKKVVYVKNGTEQLSSVTGTGCMLGALCAAFMTAATSSEAAIAACGYFGICGELAETNKGNGSFMVSLIDRISTLGTEEIYKNLNVEEKQIEKL